MLKCISSSSSRSSSSSDSRWIEFHRIYTIFMYIFCCDNDACVLLCVQEKIVATTHRQWLETKDEKREMIRHKKIHSIQNSCWLVWLLPFAFRASSLATICPALIKCENIRRHNLIMYSVRLIAKFQCKYRVEKKKKKNKNDNAWSTYDLRVGKTFDFTSRQRNRKENWCLCARVREMRDARVINLCNEKIATRQIETKENIATPDPVRRSMWKLGSSNGLRIGAKFAYNSFFSHWKCIQCIVRKHCRNACSNESALRIN